MSAALLLACTLPALGQDAPDAPPAAAEQAEQGPAPLVVRELLVIQADRYDDLANNPKLHSTALPAKIENKKGRDKRTDEAGGYQYTPMPLGIITFQGSIQEPMDLTVKLEAASSSVQANWPDDAQVGDSGVRWFAIREADDGQRAHPFGEQGAWLTDLRNSDDRVWVQSRAELRKDRFLMYDASFAFDSGVELTIDEQRYRLKAKEPNVEQPPVCVLIREREAGWSADALGAPWPDATPAIAAKAIEGDALSQLDEALVPVVDLLEQRGYSPQEIGLAESMIASAGFGKTNMSLVYVLPTETLDEHVRLLVRPEPDELIRTAIVVINNVDPDLGARVNALLDDLGSDQWIKRDRAQRELIDLGQAAIGKVRQLKNHKDPEVAFRAQQILDTFEWRMNGGK